MIAALYVETAGAYFGLKCVDPWDTERDARTYTGPHPVVAHPPCQRWGKYWHGSTRKPHQFQCGDDGGCFAAALEAVRTWGGILEHPANSHAWQKFGLTAPVRYRGWSPAGDGLGYTCYVEQGHYGHMSRKPTWLYARSTFPLPAFDWSRAEQRLHPIALARYGYEKARRIGMVAMVGGKHKTRIRNTTPDAFRDLLIDIATSARMQIIGASSTITEVRDGQVITHSIRMTGHLTRAAPGELPIASQADQGRLGR